MLKVKNVRTISVLIRLIKFCLGYLGHVLNNKSDAWYIRDFPKIAHSDSAARIVFEQNYFSKNTFNGSYTLHGTEPRTGSLCRVYST